MSLATTTCPNCGRHLDEENLTHDGYMGSPHAHNGAGSYGLGRHHHYFVCDCGWIERPETTKAKRRAALKQSRRASYAWNGIQLPKSAASMDDCKVLSCDSRMSKVEKLAEVLARKDGERGSGVGHSACASYRYVIVTKACFERAEKLVASGQFKGCNYSWWFENVLKREEVLNNDEH